MSRRVAILLGIPAVAAIALWFWPPDERPSAGVGRPTDLSLGADRDSFTPSTQSHDRRSVAGDGATATSKPSAVIERPTGGGTFRIVVLDTRGLPVPGAVAVQETEAGGKIGFRADDQGCIMLPPSYAAATTTVMAAGYLPELLQGVREEERVVLADGIRVHLEVTDGWQRLTEGFPGTRIAGAFEARLEPAGSDSLEDVPTVAIQSPGVSEDRVDLADIEAVHHSPLSPMGLADFCVARPGRYGVQVMFELVRPGNDGSSLFTMRAEPLEITVMPGEQEQHFEVRLPERTLDRALALFYGGFDQ